VRRLEAAGVLVAYRPDYETARQNLAQLSG
jgi:hypothetical protein